MFLASIQFFVVLDAAVQTQHITNQRRFIHPAASEGDQAACAHTTRAPAPPFQRGGGLAYSLRWGMMDSDLAELGLVCEAAGWMGLVGREGGREGGGGRGVAQWPTLRGGSNHLVVKVPVILMV